MEILNESHIKRLLDIAYTIAQSGQIQQANSIFDAVLKDKPTHSVALIGKALTLIMTDKFVEAEEGLKKVLEANPKDSEASALLALSYFLANEENKAKEIAQTVSDTSTDAYALAQGLLAEIR